jgi:4-oxalocrotonate tautomerase
MPLIEISIGAGRTPAQLRALIDGVHRVAEQTVDATSENITVVVREVDPHCWARGNRTIAEQRTPAPDS